MKYPKGSSIMVGLVAGIIIGLLMDDVARLGFLGLMFGTIGEMATKKSSQGVASEENKPEEPQQ